MQFMDISMISSIIKKEKLTSNSIYTLIMKGYNFEDLSLRHCDCLFSLMKILSTSGFNTEFEEPVTINLMKEDIKDVLLDDIILYLGYLNYEDERLRSLITILLETKVQVIKLLPPEMNREMRTMTLEELVPYDGREGRMAYAAVDDFVYDVTKSPVWMDGTHFGLLPGRDLTGEFSGCHSMNREILSKLPVVARFVRR